MSRNDQRLFDLKSISIETAQHIFSRHFCRGHIAHIEAITAGASTSNYKVTKEDGTSFLLRVYPEDNDHSAMEVSAYSYLKNLINVPEILVYDNSRIDLPLSCVLMQFIEGITLREYILLKGFVGKGISSSIGESLGLIHRREFPAMAILGPDFNVQKPLGSLRGSFEQYLNGIPGMYLSDEVKRKVFLLVNSSEELFARTDCEFVLSHGDFNFQNILIDKDESPWIVDFEYCFSAPRYYDIGKFFRSGGIGIDKSSLAEGFVSGYNCVSSYRLPDDWLKLAKLIEIQAMLALINREKLPDGWIESIEEEMTRNIQIVQPAF